MKKHLGILTLLVMGLSSPPLSAEDAGGSCAAPSEMQSTAAERYMMDSVNSLLTKCGLGSLLSGGLGSLGSLITGSVDGCSKPLDALAQGPLREADKYVRRSVNEGVTRPINNQVRTVRSSAMTGSWYKNDPWYANGTD